MKTLLVVLGVVAVSVAVSLMFSADGIVTLPDYSHAVVLCGDELGEDDLELMTARPRNRHVDAGLCGLRSLPLLAAPLCVVLRQRTLVWQLATGVAWASLYVSWTLLQEVQAHGPIAYHLGGWEPPFGIEYRIDMLNAFVLLIVSFVAAVVFPYARRSVDAEIPAEKHHLFYAALLLCFTGMQGIVITGDAFNVFVFLEIASLSTYSLVSLGKSRRALTSAFQYLVIGTMGGTSILIGIGLMYAVTGTLNMEDLAIRMAEMEDKRTLLVAFTFMCVGVSLKLAVFPLHFWLPNAYTYAPSVVTAFLRTPCGLLPGCCTVTLTTGGRLLLFLRFRRWLAPRPRGLGVGHGL